LDIDINEGSFDNRYCIFHGEANEYSWQEPGDIIVFIQEVAHEVFKRKGADLLIEKEITIKEALTGFDLEIDKLDGSKLQIKSN